MILCLDVGNSQLFAGVFVNGKIVAHFRYDTKQMTTSDQIGIFLRAVLRENNLNPEQVKKIAYSSVVPSIDYSVVAACLKYFKMEPFILQSGVKTGLGIFLQNPADIGSDRIANAIAVSTLYPDQDAIIVDMGTATTFCALRANKEYMAGPIIPGMRVSMLALQQNTAKLPSVEIVRPKTILGKTTQEVIQVGLYYSQLATVKEMTQLMTRDVFAGRQPQVIATGGFSYLFAPEHVFTHIDSNLVLKGIYFALLQNQ